MTAPAPPISEAASDKRRRGRPRLLTGDWARTVIWLYPDIRTDRGRQNVTYATEALKRLGLSPEDHPPQGYEHLRWLADWPASNAGRRSAVKWSILAELGRLAMRASDEAVFLAADRVCKQQLSTKEGTAVVRRFRLQRGAPPSTETLLDRLIGCVCLYGVEHPEASDHDILGAINDLYSAIQDRHR
jgi:hypothetical protein